MGSPLIKRLDALYQRAQMVMAVQADHAPFVSIAPWSFMKDECIVKYYPEGNYQKPERITTTLHDALMIIVSPAITRATSSYFSSGDHFLFVP